jgi:hypothetical protein
MNDHSGARGPYAFAMVLVGALLTACSASSHSVGFGDEPAGDDAGTPNPGAPSASGSDSGYGTFGEGGGAADAKAASGDGAVGPVDVTPPCDTGLAVDASDAALFAKAIGVCKAAGADGFGLMSASYSNAFGSSSLPAAGQWGLLPQFGSVIKPQEGSALGVISSGFAREYDDATGTSQGMKSDFVSGNPMDGTNYPTGQAPPGFPKAAAGCQQDGLVNDMVDVKLVLKAPPDATGFQFDFDFYSSEWPNYVCSNFNDAFIAYLTSQGTTGNISFDAMNNPVAVNNNFFDRCTPSVPVGCSRSNLPFPDPPLSTSTCPSGPSELGGTGFGDTYATQCLTGNQMATLGGATGWLTTKAPIMPGEQFTLEFMIWDAGDGLLDSSVLIDHFQWIGGTVSTGTTRPPQ